MQLPVTLKVAHGGQATNFAEIDSDDDRDLDSQPESQELPDPVSHPWEFVANRGKESAGQASGV